MIHTRRWNDPPGPDEGTRILVTRYRPRGVKHEDATWDEWWKELGPSAGLHAAVYGTTGTPIDWDTYRVRYLAEMEGQDFRLRALTNRLTAGETLTLVCSSACVDPARCHRTLLKQLLQQRLAKAKR